MVNNILIFAASVAERVKSRFYGANDRMTLVQLPPSFHMLLHARIRNFTIIISAWRFRTIIIIANDKMIFDHYLKVNLTNLNI